MRLLTEFVRHEVRLRLRAPGFWLLAGGYLLLGIGPILLQFVARVGTAESIGASSIAGRLEITLPLATALLSAALSVGLVNREREEGSFVVVSLSSMTNAGYLLRRWIAVLVLIGPLTFVPVVAAAGLAVLDGSPPVDLVPFLAPWILNIIPLALAASALALGLGTIAGGTIPALLAGLLGFGVLVTLGKDLLARIGRTISGPGEWLQVFGFSSFVNETTHAAQMRFFGLIRASDAPYDIRAAAEGYWSEMGLYLGLSAAVLGVSVAFLRRTRRDLRPWSIREGHPLRSFLRFANRLRATVIPERGLGWRDRLLVGSGLAILILAVGLHFQREGRYRRLALQRYETEIAGTPEPTTPSMVPGAWRIAGEVDRRGNAHLHVTAEFENLGTEPVSHLAFTLNPSLEILALRAEGALVRHERKWDRVAVSIEPSIGTRVRRTLEFELKGVPSTEHFEVSGSGSFNENFAAFLQARHSNELSDLARSWTERSISSRRIALEASDLSPVPRYTSWALVELEKIPYRPGNEIPSELAHPPGALAIDVRAPGGLLLADSCGHLSVQEEGVTRLRGECFVSLSRYAIRGGRMSMIDDAVGLGDFAVLPAHRAQAELHLPIFVSAADLAARVFPGLDPFEDSVILEWPPAFDPTRTEAIWALWGFQPSKPSLDAIGKLVLVPESELVSGSTLEAGEIAAAAVADALLDRRPVVSSQVMFFRNFYRWMAHSRMGVGSTTSVIRGQLRGREFRQASMPILEARRWDHGVWSEKLPALFAYLERDVGSNRFLEGVDAFLEGQADDPGTAEALLGAIEARSGVPLGGVYRDYLAGEALPQPSLLDVVFRQEGSGWLVTGSVENRGSGSTTCAVVLKTETGSISTMVDLEAGRSAPFLVRSPSRPRTVSLDPEEICFRYIPKPRGNFVDRVEYRGGA